MFGKLVLEDGDTFEGEGFGRCASVSGEIVFNTGMVGYAESMTDPSYLGQILTFTYPLVGNYGVPSDEEKDGMAKFFESDRIHVKGVVVNTLSEKFSHWNSTRGLDGWMKERGVPGLTGVDTRRLTKKLRDGSPMLAKIVFDNVETPFADPNLSNLVARVSIAEPVFHPGTGEKRVVLIDCGSKYGIVRKLLERGVGVLRTPWNHDFLNEDFDGVMISNGPGDPFTVSETVELIRRLFEKGKPIFGICLGHQLMALAAGAKTYKLRFGHRSQNQPCVMAGSKKCCITSQNHGYAVDPAPLSSDWKTYFFNANDGSNEGLKHLSRPFFSVQFHPEAMPGPVDTEFLFDDFIRML